MIVTCENCNARYKLDDAKVSGRGAKITCPRCKHVFVVHREEAAPRRPVELGAGPATMLRSAPMPDPTPDPTPKARPAAAAPKRDVHGLDFRKVGISSWRVKVKIGLIYDFSDYKTLRKYIQDGRVTQADLLSHDGRNWTAIGDIPDLERHFVDVYESAERSKVEEESTRPLPDAPGTFDDGPTSIVGMADLANSLADQMAGGFKLNAASDGASRSATMPPRGGTIPPQSKTIPPQSKTIPPRSGARGLSPAPLELGGDASNADAFEIAKARQRDRLEANKASARTDAPARSSSAIRIVLALVVIIAAAVGVWYLQRQQQAVNAPPPSPVVEQPKVEGPASAEDIRSRIREELQKELEQAPTADPIDVKPDRQLIPVKPSAPRNDQAARPTGRPPPTKDTTPTGSITAAPTTARDLAEAGDDAWRRSAWSEAAAAYRDAVRLEGTSATYQMKLGRSLYKAGDSSGAMSYLAYAQRNGVYEASKWLGHIARDQGDVAGAVGHYNTYLKSSPSDAAEIQREIDALTGG